MSLLALGIVLVAAFTHATWNLAAKCRLFAAGGMVAGVIALALG